MGNSNVVSCYHLINEGIEAREISTLPKVSES